METAGNTVKPEAYRINRFPSIYQNDDDQEEEVVEVEKMVDNNE
jgi:hypothetical protein